MTIGCDEKHNERASGNMVSVFCIAKRCCLQLVEAGHGIIVELADGIASGCRRCGSMGLRLRREAVGDAWLQFDVVPMLIVFGMRLGR